MTSARLLARQIRYANLSFWRNPTSAFFTFAFPLMFLVIFTSLLGTGKVQLPGRTVSLSTYYVAAMATYGVVSACFSNLGMTLTFHRDAGILKRLRGTPLSRATYLASRIIHAIAVAIALVAVTALLGRTAYHATLPTGASLGQFAAMLVVGALTFSALAFAISGAIPNAEAAPAVINATIMPLLFLSGIFIPLGTNAPAWILWVARVFPVRHFVVGMQSAFLGTAFHWSDVGIVALWGVGGFLVARRAFRWDPPR